MRSPEWSRRSQSRVLLPVTALILLQQPVQQLEPGLLANRPPDADLGRVMPDLQIEVVPSVRPHHGLISHHMKITNSLNGTLVAIRVMNAVVSRGQSPRPSQHQLAPRCVELNAKVC